MISSMDPVALPANEHRFLVRTAEEAVQMIREQLGERAQVTSVRRLERGGLTGLFRGAQLEVIARVPAPPAAIAPTTAFSLPAPTPAEAAAVKPWEAEERRPSAPPEPVAPTHETLRPLLPAEPAATAEGPMNSRLTGLLRRVGMTDVLLARLQTHPEWPRIERLTLAAALPETVSLLRREYGAVARTPLGTRLAFVGMAGAGSTSLLCKHLARTVFSLGQRAAVLRLETDRPNPIDGLAAICELWGVSLLRSVEEIPAIEEGTRLFVDVPGLTESADAGEEAKIAARLERLSIPSRVWVLNAAYEPALLKGLCRRAELLGCKHLAFTHLDELVHWGKLWEFLLHRDLWTASFSLGPMLPGDFTEDVLETTLGKTFS